MGNIIKGTLNKDGTISIKVDENTTNSPLGIVVTENTIVHLTCE